MFSEYIKRAVLVFISIIVTFLIIEGLLRLGAWEFYYDQKKQNTKTLLSKGEKLVVLCVGESTTAMGRTNSWPSQLQRILNNIQDQRVFRVINKGVPATDTSEILDHLPGYITKHKPDFVLAMVGINDGYLEGHDETFKNFDLFQKIISSGPWFITLLSQSRTYGLIRWMTEGMKFRFTGKTEDMSTASLVGEISNEGKPVIYGLRNPDATHLYPKTINNLNNMVNLATAKGIHFIFVQYPLRKIDILKNVIKRDVFYTSNYETFLMLLKQNNYDDLFTDRIANDFGHATPFGNRIIAGNVARQLLKIFKP